MTRMADLLKISVILAASFYWGIKYAEDCDDANTRLWVKLALTVWEAVAVVLYLIVS